MEKKKDAFRNEYKLLKDKKRLLLLFAILFVLGLAFSRYISAALFSIVFILLGGVSKIYHRFIHTSAGIDLVFFFTAMMSMVYKNPFFSFLVGWIGLVMADSLGTRFSHTSVVSLLSLTAVIFASSILSGFGLISALIILTIIYEAVAACLYYIMGSSPGRIFLFVSTHLLFNLFLILTFAKILGSIMV